MFQKNFYEIFINQEGVSFREAFFHEGYGNEPDSALC